MFQPQITSPNSAAHYTGMLATFDGYRRQKAGAKKEKTRRRPLTRLATAIAYLSRKVRAGGIGKVAPDAS